MGYRCAYRGREIAKTGNLTLPLPSKQRERVLSVKRCEVSQADVSDEITRVEAYIRDLLDDGAIPLPEFVDLARINQWAVGAQRRHWGWE